MVRYSDAGLKTQKVMREKARAGEGTLLEIAGHIDDVDGLIKDLAGVNNETTDMIRDHFENVLGVRRDESAQRERATICRILKARTSRKSLKDCGFEIGETTWTNCDNDSEDEDSGAESDSSKKRGRPSKRAKVLEVAAPFLVFTSRGEHALPEQSRGAAIRAGVAAGVSRASMFRHLPEEVPTQRDYCMTCLDLHNMRAGDDQKLKNSPHRHTKEICPVPDVPASEVQARELYLWHERRVTEFKQEYERDFAASDADSNRVVMVVDFSTDVIVYPMQGHGDEFFGPKLLSVLGMRIRIGNGGDFFRYVIGPKTGKTAANSYRFLASGCKSLREEMGWADYDKKKIKIWCDTAKGFRAKTFLGSTLSDSPLACLSSAPAVMVRLFEQNHGRTVLGGSFKHMKDVVAAVDARAPGAALVQKTAGEVVGELVAGGSGKFYAFDEEGRSMWGFRVDRLTCMHTVERRGFDFFFEGKAGGPVSDVVDGDDVEDSDADEVDIPGRREADQKARQVLARRLLKKQQWLREMGVKLS